MTSARRSIPSPTPLAGLMILLLCLAASSALAMLALRHSRRVMPDRFAGGLSPEAPTWTANRVGPDAGMWSAFVSRDDGSGADGQAGALARRFRLAGTFFVTGGGEGEKRRAVLDDLRESAQRVVAEGDAIGDVQVLRILHDRAVLRQGAVEEVLWLSSSKQGPAGAAPTAGTTGAGASSSETADRFGGIRAGENRWVYQRESLMGYYREVLAQPERLVALFDSLKPVYDDNRMISGYRLNVEGESEFFRSVGLEEGDVVRSANSIPMTNRRRAEYLIRQFAENRANAFVLDIERKGAPAKLVYEIR